MRLERLLYVCAQAPRTSPRTDGPGRRDPACSLEHAPSSSDEEEEVCGPCCTCPRCSRPRHSRPCHRRRALLAAALALAALAALAVESRHCR